MFNNYFKRVFKQYITLFEGPLTPPSLSKTQFEILVTIRDKKWHFWKVIIHTSSYMFLDQNFMGIPNLAIKMQNLNCKMVKFHFILKYFQVLSFFENEGFLNGILQLLSCTLFFTQFVIRKAKTGSPHSAGNMFSYGL